MMAQAPALSRTIDIRPTGDNPLDLPFATRQPAGGARVVAVDSPIAYVGTQGWSVPGWEGLLYPKGLKASRKLFVYSRIFNSIEVNSTFYALPAIDTVRNWLDRTPPGFRFALKTPRSITHGRGLRESARDLSDFLKVAELFGEKLGPVLVQLPPSFGASALPVLSEFLRRLPVRAMRFCVEMRRPSLHSAGVRNLMHRRGVGLVTTNLLTPPGSLDAIGGLAYLRLLGPRRTPGGAGRDSAIQTLEEFASASSLWTAGMRIAHEKGADVYAFVSNDYYGPAVLPAAQLMKQLGMPAQLRSGSFVLDPRWLDPRWRNQKRETSLAEAEPGAPVQGLLL